MRFTRRQPNRGAKVENILNQNAHYQEIMNLKSEVSYGLFNSICAGIRHLLIASGYSGNS
jgi:hypothetical protein